MAWPSPIQQTAWALVVEGVGGGLELGGGGNGDESEAVGCLYTDQSEEGASYPLPILPTLTSALSRYWTFKAEEIRIGFGLGTVLPSGCS